MDRLIVFFQKRNCLNLQKRKKLQAFPKLEFMVPMTPRRSQRETGVTCLIHMFERNSFEHILMEHNFTCWNILQTKVFYVFFIIISMKRYGVSLSLKLFFFPETQLPQLAETEKKCKHSRNWNSWTQWLISTLIFDLKSNLKVFLERWID